MDIKEEFCGACLAIPLALAGVSTAGVGATKKGHGKSKKIMLWSGLGITVISVIIAIIYISKCKTCR
jgi:DNA transposition AAA+ family ATPase